MRERERERGKKAARAGSVQSSAYKAPVKSKTAAAGREEAAEFSAEG